MGAHERIRWYCGWALAVTDGPGAIGRSTRPHVFYFWAMDDRPVLPATMVLMRDGFGRAVQDAEI